MSLGAFVKNAVAVSAFVLLSFVRPALADSVGPIENPFTAYPPSCLADPLPTDSEGPVWTARVNLATQHSGGSATEDVTFVFWRTPCIGGKTALLGRIERDAANEGRTDVEPLFPDFSALQGTKSGPMRVAVEPNTVRTSIARGTPLAASTTFVFEKFPDPAAVTFDFLHSLTVTINGTAPANVVIPNYDPSLYDESSQPLQISGYNTGAYYDKSHSGEGIMLEIGEHSPTSRYVFIGWFTYGPDGRPYWISGSTNFTPRARTVTIPMSYTGQGGFAGNFGPKAQATDWGTLRINAVDCKTINFSYRSIPLLPDDVPQGNGARTWSKLTSINGLNCD